MDVFDFGPRSVPQTGQRVAVSESRVPHVGQTWVFWEVGSGVIRAKIIPQKKVWFDLLNQRHRQSICARIASADHDSAVRIAQDDLSAAEQRALPARHFLDLVAAFR